MYAYFISAVYLTNDSRADEGELKVFSREYFDNMVGVVPYYISMVLTSLPISLTLPSVFCVIVYWMAGMRADWDAFLWFLLIMTCASTSTS